MTIETAIFDASMIVCLSIPWFKDFFVASTMVLKEDALNLAANHFPRNRSKSMRGGDVLFRPLLGYGEVTFSELLGMTLPPVRLRQQQQQQPPHDYNWASRFTIVHWASLSTEVQDFMRALPREAAFATDGVDNWKQQVWAWMWSDRYTLANPVQHTLMNWTPEEVYPTINMLIKGQPDVCAIDSVTKCTLLVGDMEIGLLGHDVPDICSSMNDSDDSPFWAALGRLHEHMKLCAASYGFLATDTSTWFCARVDDYNDGLAISSPVPRSATTLGHLWYLMICALDKHSGHPHAHFFAPPYVVWRLAKRNIQEEALRKRVKQIVTAGIRGFRSKTVHKKIQFWNIDTEFTPDSSSDHEVLIKKTCFVGRARWRGAQVVLKVRDLSDSRKSRLEDLHSFLAEIMIYKHLKKLQGDVIPKLLGYGFASGAMLGILVLSEGGFCPTMSDPLMTTPDAPAAAAAVVRKIHDQGVLHGDLYPESLLVKSRAPLQLTAVSLSKASKSVDRGARADEILFARGIMGDTSADSGSD